MLKLLKKLWKSSELQSFNFLLVFNNKNPQVGDFFIRSLFIFDLIVTNNGLGFVLH